MRRRGPSGPSSRPSRPPRLASTAGLLLAVACASARLPQPSVTSSAAAAASYSGSLRVSVRGADVRGRTHVLVAFRRPDAVRIEIPGPSGARLVTVAREGRLVAVFPAERAVLESGASPTELAALLGIALAPEELMGVLVGTPPERARSYEVRWGATLPKRVEVVLSDGTRLKAAVDDAEAGVSLPAAAFDFPPHDGYRPVDAEEARRLLGGR